MATLIENGTYPILEWTFGAAAILVTAGRFLLRRLHPSQTGSPWRWDDLFTLLALLSLIGFLASLHELEFTTDPAAGPKWELSGDLLLWTTMYLVKASFLALCWHLFKISPNFRRAWWVVAIYTFLTFWPVFLSELWQCGSPAQYADVQACTDSNEDQAVWWRIDPLAFRFAFHISSDVFILALPLVFIGRIQTSRARKVSVAGIFALIIIDIVCGILRNAGALCASLNVTTTDTCISIGLVMDVCEPSIAVIVCALPAYRVLLPSEGKRRYRQMEQQRRERDTYLMRDTTVDKSTQTQSSGEGKMGSVSSRGQQTLLEEPEPAFMV